VAQPINRSLHRFEAQTKKPSRWFWPPNHQTEPASFEAKTGKHSTILVLRLNQETVRRFWGQTGRNRRHQFEAKLKKIIVTGFEAKLEKTAAAGFEDKLLEIAAAIFEAKPAETVLFISPSKRLNDYYASNA
jgi:hypothetical protein